MQEFNRLLSSIKGAEIAPIYLLAGKEPYFIDRIDHQLCKALIDDASRDFDQTIFYGKETQVDVLIETVKRYPMLAPYQLVIIREAQSMDAACWEALASYAEHPTPKTVLVICHKYKDFDKRKKLYKNAQKTGVIFESSPIYENKLPAWITSCAKEMGLSIAPESTVLLAEFLGANLSAIEKELEKLKLVIAAPATVTPEDIEKHIGISKDFNAFELQKAMGMKQFSRAFRIIQHMSHNPKNHPLVLVLSSLHSYFQKLLLYKGLKNPGDAPKVLGVSPYFISEYDRAARHFSMRQISSILHLILKADLQSKGIEGPTASPQEILETLLLKSFSV